MLQKVDFEDDFQALQEEDRSHLLQPAFYWALFKRRWAYFFIPFVVIAAAGAGFALLLPATYSSEGKILVQSQQIPTELVRPTVTSAAQERIQVIEQRTMTRDNLIAIADKFQLFPDKRPLIRATDTTKFLSREVQKLLADNAALDARIAQLRLSQGKASSSANVDQSSTML